MNTERLNLRSGPGACHPVLGELTRGQVITVFPVAEGAWVSAAAMLQGGPALGWVNGDFLKSKDATATTEPKVVFVPTPSLIRSPLSISDTDLNCDEDLFEGGYKECEVTIDLRYQGHEDVEGQFWVDCEVTASLGHEDDIIPSSETFDGSDSLYVSSGYGSATVTVDISPSFSFRRLISVRVTDAECRYRR